MRKSLLFMFVLAAVIGCKPKMTIIEGSVKGGNGEPVIISTVWQFGRDTLTVSPDGTFRLEKQFPENTSAAIQVGKLKRTNFYILPGKVHHLDVDLTAEPATVSNTGAGIEETQFYDYYSNVYTSLSDYDFPLTFKEHCANWDIRYEAAMEEVNKLSSKKSRKFFSNSVYDSRDFYRFIYIWQVQKREERLDSDPDFNKFFDSIDLSRKNNQKSLLSSMITVKAECREEGSDYSVAYLDAVESLAPTKELKDSLKMKYAVKAILNGEVSSPEGGDALLEVVDALVTDSEALADYHARVEKAASLLPGSAAIDFELLDLDGRTVRLSDFRGKVVYIDFWASWCIPCCLQIPYMKILADKYASAADVATISVSFDDSHEDMVKVLVSEPPTWPQYKTDDGGDAIMDAYGFRAIPRFMIIDKEGRIVNVDAPRPQDIDAVSALIEGAR